MRQKFWIDPDRTAPWGAADLKEFLRQAHEYLNTWKNRHPCHGKNHLEEPIHWLYRWGRDHRVAALDYEQFRWEMLSLESRRQEKKRRRAWSRLCAQKPGRWQDPLPYRVRNQHAHFPKKVLSETEMYRRAWREHKGFNRDQQKAGGRYNQSKGWAKRASNKSERCHVRNCLHHEKEILHHRWFKDAWMWD